MKSSFIKPLFYLCFFFFVNSCVHQSSLENIYHFNQQIVCGSAPTTQADFLHLQSLGVKSLISVDGARPQLKMAKAFEMVYRHVPYGYDKVPLKRQKELLKAFDELPKPVYIHCHHGVHRAPTGAVIILQNFNGLKADDAIEMLRAIGTSQEYSGLYKSVASAQKIDSKDWQQAESREVEKLSELTESMAAIDRVWDRLKASEKKNWKSTTGESPQHDALILKEHFVELGRHSDAKFSEEYSELSSVIAKLELGIKEKNHQQSSEAMKWIGQSCRDCHRSHRD